LRLSQRLVNMDRRIAAFGVSRPSIRGDFFLLSAVAFFSAPNISARRSMTGGPHAQGPSDQRAGHFPLACPLASDSGAAVIPVKKNPKYPPQRARDKIVPPVTFGETLAPNPCAPRAARRLASSSSSSTFLPSSLSSHPRAARRWRLERRGAGGWGAGGVEQAAGARRSSA
jgi:hypothetical protein